MDKYPGTGEGRGSQELACTPLQCCFIDKQIKIRLSFYFPIFFPLLQAWQCLLLVLQCSDPCTDALVMPHRDPTRWEVAGVSWQWSLSSAGCLGL